MFNSTFCTIGFVSFSQRMKEQLYNWKVSYSELDLAACEEIKVSIV